MERAIRLDAAYQEPARCTRTRAAAGTRESQSTRALVSACTSFQRRPCSSSWQTGSSGSRAMNQAVMRSRTAWPASGLPLARRSSARRAWRRQAAGAPGARGSDSRRERLRTVNRPSSALWYAVLPWQKAEEGGAGDPLLPGWLPRASPSGLLLQQHPAPGRTEHQVVDQLDADQGSRRAFTSSIRPDPGAPAPTRITRSRYQLDDFAERLYCDEWTRGQNRPRQRFHRRAPAGCHCP